jgi:hypothetical protein
MWIEHVLIVCAVLTMTIALVFHALNWRMSIQEKEAAAYMKNGRRQWADFHFRRDSIRLFKSFVLWNGSIHMLFWHEDRDTLLLLLAIMTAIYMIGLAIVGYLSYAERYALLYERRNEPHDD